MMADSSNATSGGTELSDVPDCVVVGYHDRDIADVERSCEGGSAHSGAYHQFKTNTIPYAGRREQPMTVLNRAIHGATGVDPGLHVAKLPNLGACYLTSYLRRRGLRTELVNFFSGQRAELAELITLGRTSVAITTTFYVDPEPIAEIVRFIRAVAAETTVIVGGPFVFNTVARLDEAAQEYLFDEIGADVYIVESQGEGTLHDVVATVSSRGDLRRVPNVIWREQPSRFHRTDRAPESNDLNAELIDWSSFETDLYTPTVQMRTARSCAFKCSFCRYPVVAGPLALTSIENVERELRQLAAAGVRNVVFVDDTFNVPLPRFKALCRMMIRNAFEFSWFSYFRCSNADDETFELMARSGCRGVFLGIESADVGVLKHMNKAATPERYAYGIGRLKEHGILTFVSLIVGFPGETSESVHRTAEFIDTYEPTFYRAELYYHDPITPVQQQAEALGIRGRGYAWSHLTMDWRQAADHIATMYQSIGGSTILPVYMFDFWSLPYLVGRGISMDTIRAFTRITHRMLVQGLDSVKDDRASEMELVQLFQSTAHEFGGRALA